MFAIATRNFASSGIRSWDIVDDALTNARTYSAPSSQVLGASLSPEGDWFAYGQTSTPWLQIRNCDHGTLGANVTPTARPDAVVNDTQWSPTGEFLAVAHNSNGSGVYAGNNLSVFRLVDGDLERIDSIGPVSGNGFRVAWSPNGKHLLLTRTANWQVSLVAFDGAALTSVASSALGSGSGTANYKREVNFLTNDRAVVSRQTTFDHISIPDLSLIQNDLIGTLFGLGETHLVAARQSGSTGNSHIYSLGSELVSVATTDSEIREPAPAPDNNLIFTHDASNALLYSFSGSTITQIDTEAWSSTINRALIWPYHIPQQPPTSEEIFRASFADAFGRDPQSTALRVRSDARALAGHNVINYLYPPDYCRRTMYIRLEERELLTEGSMHWFKNERDPQFWMGRWAQIQGVRDTPDPTTVDLLLRIDDNPLSFIEP